MIAWVDKNRLWILCTRQLQSLEDHGKEAVTRAKPEENFQDYSCENKPFLKIYHIIFQNGFVIHSSLLQYIYSYLDLRINLIFTQQYSNYLRTAMYLIEIDLIWVLMLIVKWGQTYGPDQCPISFRENENEIH